MFVPQNQLRDLQGSDAKVRDLETKNSALQRETEEMAAKLRKLEKADQEFSDLEKNIARLQVTSKSLLQLDPLHPCPSSGIVKKICV